MIPLQSFHKEAYSDGTMLLGVIKSRNISLPSDAEASDEPADASSKAFTHSEKSRTEQIAAPAAVTGVKSGYASGT